MGKGTLKVSFGGESVFLKNNLPVEVRNHNDALVARRHGSFTEDLPAGLYRLRATLPDGSGHDELVFVESQKVVERFLSPWGVGTTEPAFPGESVHRKERGYPQIAEIERTPRGDSPPADSLWATSPGDEARVSVEVVDLTNCAVAAREGASFVFVPDYLRYPYDRTPSAVLSIDGRRVSLSLPINPVHHYPGDACVVAITERSGGVHQLVTRFARQRLVATAIEGLVRSDRLLYDTDLLDGATEALRAKYYDAPAAALGGLTLHRLGRLGERTRWVENLARRFRWLPDGRVLLAALRCRDEDALARKRALDILLEASAHRMMFADGLALLVELLRRWPDGQGEADRHGILARVVHTMAGVDWDAIFLTIYEADPL